jgi:hypothetical protein
MLFDRVYRLQIGKKGQDKGIEIEGLRIQFSIQKTADKNPNNSTIKIWNLRKTTRQEIEKPNTRCLLYAGYSEDTGPILIFSGSVTYAWTKFEPPDIVTELNLGDGVQEIRDTTISVGYGKNIKSKQIFTDVAKKMDLSLTLPNDAPEREWQNGLSYYGSARTLLDKTAKASGLEWSIQNGVLQVIEKGMVTTRQGIEISSSSGMVGSPDSEREDKAEAKGEKGKSGGGKSSEPKQQWNGWKVKTLLMPMLNPGDRVMLNSKAVEGVFRIEELTHTGDNWEGDWQTELKLVDTAKPLGDKKTSKGGAAPQRSTEKASDKLFMPGDSTSIYRGIL